MSLKILFGIAAAVGFAAVSSAFAATGDASTGAVSASTGASTAGTYLSALDVNGEVKVDATSSGSVTLSWDKVAAATSYVVFYDVKSPDVNDPNATYAKMSDPVSVTGATISGLQADTTYYMMVLAMDAQGNESSQGSKEVVAKTSAATATATSASGAAFGLADNAVATTSATTLTLSFNKKLDASKPVSVSVVSNQDKSTVAATVTVAADASKADVVLGSALVQGSSYTLTVKLATSQAGENVQAGANAVREFVYDVSGASTGTVDEFAVPAAVSTGAAPVALNAAPAVSSEAAAKSLPETGPAENLVAAMALVLGAAAVFVLRRRKA